MVLETNYHAQTFGAFYEQWLTRQERYLQELLQLIERESGDEEKELRSKYLINQVMAHYNEYYKAKARITRDNVFLVLTPPWLSSFGRANIWLGGFRVGQAFRVVANSVSDLTEDQSQRINTLKNEVKEEEKELTNELARLQEGMTSTSIVELARHLGRPQNGAAATMDAAFERLRASLETLVQCADSLRMKTAMKLMETLKPIQGVRFLATAAQMWIRLHRYGVQRDARVQRRNDSL